MTMSDEKQGKRDLVLDAATQIIIEKGAFALTLDAVAAQAGVSKGGLLYHFPSKEALLKGMIERYLSEFSACIHQVAAGLPDVRGRLLRAYIMTSLQNDHASSALLVTVLGMIVNQSDLCRPIVHHYEEWLERLSADGTPRALAQIALLTTDGAWLSEALHMPFMLDGVQHALLTLIDRMQLGSADPE
jgi:AcrR family transcriptional regulator